MKMIEVTIEGLALDMSTNTPVVILSPSELDRVLPIWIGHAEAWAIAMELQGVKSNRPLTHDLMRRAVESLGARVDRVEITGLEGQTFFAVIWAVDNVGQYQIDARPSDSIALALKSGATIYVNEELFYLSDNKPPAPETMPTDREELRERLRKINPEDFGKYSL